MPGLLSCQKRLKLRKCAMIAGFDAVSGAVNLLGDLLKSGAVEHFAAEDTAIQRMEDVLVDKRAQLGT